MKEVKRLRDCVPLEFIRHYTDNRAYKMLNVEVLSEHRGYWIGSHKNVHCWWKLANGYAVGWNENPSVGWSFPVVKLQSPNH